MTTTDPVEDVLSHLREVIQARVRAEQLVNRLTGLGNGEALEEWLKEKIDTGDPFWIGFVEIDHFKAVNTEFGHAPADEMLRKVAGRLQNASRDYFGEGCAPFHPHGDEFFIAGRLVGEEQITGGLDQLRREIAQIRIHLLGRDRPMMCKVSIGWLQSSDAAGGSEGLTHRSVLANLELAVAGAKAAGRNRVVRFNAAMQAVAFSERRSDCEKCRTQFSMIVPKSDGPRDALYCPNCGHRYDRFAMAGA